MTSESKLSVRESFLNEYIIDAFKKCHYENFFECVWREKLLNILEEERKFEKLLKWIDDQINLNFSCINIFNPADKTDEYPSSYFKNYKNACMNVAMLTDFKLILRNEITTTQMRNNIEETICKMFKIYYSEVFNDYLSKVK